MSSNIVGNDQLPSSFDSFLKHRLLSREEERHLALLTKEGPASYPVRVTVRNRKRQTRACRTEARTFHKAPARFALGISRPSMDSKVHGVVHFSVENFGAEYAFRPEGVAVAIFRPRKHTPEVIIPCKHDSRWGWYARWNSRVLSNGPYRAVVFITERLALRATHELMGFNYRFVLGVARKYLWSGLPLEDLFGIGVTGLQRGIEKYDPRSGNKLNTYAIWWVRQAINYECKQTSRTIRVPHNQWDRHYHTQKALKEFEKPGVPADLVAVATYVSKKTDKDVTVEMVEETLHVFASDVLPLDIPSKQDPGFSALDVIADDKPDALSELVAHNERHAACAVLSILAPREKQMMEMRFGIGDGELHTLESIGDAYGISRERVRQIESACLKKMRCAMK